MTTSCRWASPRTAAIVGCFLYRASCCHVWCPVSCPESRRNLRENISEYHHVHAALRVAFIPPTRVLHSRQYVRWVLCALQIRDMVSWTCKWNPWTALSLLRKVGNECVSAYQVRFSSVLSGRSLFRWNTSRICLFPANPSRQVESQTISRPESLLRSLMTLESIQKGSASMKTATVDVDSCSFSTAIFRLTVSQSFDSDRKSTRQTRPNHAK